MFKGSLLKFFGLLFTTLFLISCGEADKSGNARVVVKIPEKLPQQKLNSSLGIAPSRQAPGGLRLLSDIWAPAFAPTKTSDLNCFGVVVGGPEDEGLANNFCERVEGGDISFSLKKLGASFGEEISLEVTPGEDREIRILAWQAENEAACQSLIEGTEVESKQLSHPFIIATDIRDLEPGNQEITIDASLTGAEELLNCDVFTAKLGSLSTRTFTLGGTITGNKEVVPGNNLILQVNGSGGQEVLGNGPFSLSDVVGDAVEYIVSIAQQPAGKICEISNNSGTIEGDNITDIAVTCEDIPLTIGGTVMGLDNFEGRNLILAFNDSTSSVVGEGTETLEITENGAFQFTNTLLHNSPFNIFVSQQPIGETCVVSNGSGVTNGVNITNVVINCSTNIFPVGGTVTGLLPERSFTLQNILGENESGEDLVIDQNGGFVFINGVEFNTQFNVSVKIQPPGMNCTVENGSAVMGEDDVNNVNVTCVPLPFNVGGTITGMVPNRAIDLSLSFSDTSLTESFISNGSFRFFQKVLSGTSFSVSIATLPIGHACSVSNAIGVPFDSDITNVNIDCTPRDFSIGGELTGLIAGRSVTLQNNGGDAITLSENGNFTFPTEVLTGNNYDVTVATQPPGQSCTVTNGNAETLGNNVTNISVSCSPLSFTVGGTASGLVGGQQATIEVVPSQGSTVSSLVGNGSYAIGPVITGSNFTASISAQPLGHDCSLSNSSGLVFDQNITNVDLNCTPQTFTIGGTLTGLISGRSITLQNNNGDDLTLSANESFTFATSLDFASSYSVSVLTQPPGQTCTVTNGSGTITTASAVSNVSVSCVPDAFSVSVTVSGLISGRSVTLQNNEEDDLVVNTNGVLTTFSQAINSDEDYEVTVFEPAAGMNCEVSNDSGTIFDSNIIDVTVACTPIDFTIGGTVVGMPDSGNLVLQNNEGDDLSISENGAFTFSTPVASGQSFAITVLTNPTNFTCTVSGESGVVFDTNITTPVVTCIEDTFTIGGTITGLAEGETLILSRDETENISLVGDGNASQTYTFPTALVTGTEFTIFVDTQPSEQTCTVSNGEGAINADNVQNVDVDCVNNPLIADGSFDVNFGGSGLVEIDTSSDDQKQQIEIDNSGKLSLTFQSFDSRLSACRLNSDGSFDSSWNSGSCQHFLNLNGETSVIPNALALDSSGQMVVAGQVNGSEMFTAKLLDNGTGLDTSFNSSGIQKATQTCSADTPATDQGSALVIDSQSGNIYVGGQSLQVETEGLTWWSLISTGAFNTDFSDNALISGAACIDQNPSTIEDVQAVTLDSQSRLLTTSRFNADIRITRHEADSQSPSSASLDTTFGTNGIVDLDVASLLNPVDRSTDIANDIIVDDQGRIYIAGAGLLGDDAIVIRFLSDGSVDSSFGNSGVASLNQGGVEKFEKILIDQAGNIVAVGYNETTNTGLIARFDDTGSLDTNFATNGVLTRLNVLFEDAVLDDEGNIYGIGRHDNGINNVTTIVLKVN